MVPLQTFHLGMGGRATDIHVVRDSGFLKKLEPFDQVMADRGFKIQSNLLSHSLTLCIYLHPV